MTDLQPSGNTTIRSDTPSSPTPEETAKLWYYTCVDREATVHGAIVELEKRIRERDAAIRAEERERCARIFDACLGGLRARVGYAIRTEEIEESEERTSAHE